MNNSKHLSVHRLNHRSQAGLSLVELMVAIALGLFLTWGAIQAFLLGKQTYVMQQGLSRIQENARMAQELIGFDVRDAGNYGCAVGKFVSNFNTVNLLPGTVLGSGSRNPTAERNFAYAVFAMNNVSGAENADTVLLNNLNPAPVAGTDVLITQNATNLGAQVLTAPAPTFTQITVNERDFAINDILSISDCTKNYIVQATNVASGGGTSTITMAPLPELPLPGSTVMRLSTTIYYIGLNTFGQPALYRRVNAGNSEELLVGVESLQIEVGVDTNNDTIVNEFRSPDLITPAQWNAWDDVNNDGDVLEDMQAASARVEQNVVAIRYSLLFRSEENLQETIQPYTYNGQTVTPTDRRLRQIVTSTVGIRSRSN